MPLSFLTSASWHNEPSRWTFNTNSLSIVAEPKSDFWRETNSGAHPDSGHFFSVACKGDFSVVAEFTGNYEVLYDQVGLMLRVDKNHWVKCGIEYFDRVTNFTTVVTQGVSDWSAVQCPYLSGPQSVRLVRKGNVIYTHFKDTNGRWRLMRLANFEAPQDVMVGPMACAPLRDLSELKGFRCSFSRFTITDAPDDPLHAS
ncbi:DUF1349 domain-containing protein [uncultured Cohaesibacter sp.]|uniref:DUF1349 domain-containing protein n=1 Tax=uncultured Cohaesibacter sp. TaxID=1002546 RepID=UPI0029C7A76E|nr:DUF1349 domain-containing protein [uncultured Cohaesibacter sp.]